MIGMGDVAVLHLMCIPGIIMLFHDGRAVRFTLTMTTENSIVLLFRGKSKRQMSQVHSSLIRSCGGLSFWMFPHIPKLFIIILLYHCPSNACHYFRGNTEMNLSEIHELKQSDKCNAMY